MKESWDNFWEERGATNSISWSKIRINNILNNYIKPGIHVLDLGCGSGFFSGYFISKGCAVYCLDYSENALQITKKNTGHKAKMYIKGDICDEKTFLGIDVKFDIIFTDGLLEHYHKDKQDEIIQKMNILKRQEGRLINFVPNKFSLWNVVRPFFINIQEKSFTMQELVDLHTRNGLKVILSGGINVLPFRFSPERMGAQCGMLLYCIAE